MGGVLLYMNYKRKEEEHLIRNSSYFREEQNASIHYYPTKTIKIQRTSSDKYFVNWSFFKREGEYNSFLEEGKSFYSAEKMPKILTEYKECWENNDWSGWEKELKDNHLLVKERKRNENGAVSHQTWYEFFPVSELEREEKELEERKKEHERIRKDHEEIRRQHEQIRKEHEELRRKNENEWRVCTNCGKHFCLGEEGTVKKTWSSDNEYNQPKTEYFCGKEECQKRK